jgi:predicted RNA-binding Zn-ribbon protein involved in translation (DUF1610 family)
MTDESTPGTERKTRPSQAIKLYDCPNCGAFDWARNSWAVNDRDEIQHEGFICLECGGQLDLGFRAEPVESAERLEAVRRGDAKLEEMEDGYREFVVKNPSGRSVDTDNERSKRGDGQ